MKHKWQGGMYSGMAADKLKFIQKTGDGKSMAKQTDDAQKITEESNNKQDALNAAKNKTTVTGTAVVKGTTYKKYSDGSYTMTKDGNTTSSSKTAYVGAKKSTSSDENKKISQANAKDKKDAQTTANKAKKASSDRNDANAAGRRAEVAEEKAMGVNSDTSKASKDFEISSK